MLSRKLSIVPTLLPLQPEIKRSQAVQPTSEHQTQHKVWTFEEFWIYCMLRIFFWGKETSHFVQKISRPLDRPREICFVQRDQESPAPAIVSCLCVCVPLFILFMSHSLTSCKNSNHQKRYTNGIHQSNMISCNVARRGMSRQVVATLFKPSAGSSRMTGDQPGHISQPTQCWLIGFPILWAIIIPSKPGRIKSY